MTELTDLEICKKIAEVEGLTCELRESLFGNKILYALTESHGGLKSYNPLTDDALCFQLMVKYKIDLVWVSSLLNGDNRVYAKNTRRSNLVNKAPIKDVNKAICLAIIEAHNE